jgi:hypothetical protein
MADSMRVSELFAGYPFGQPATSEAIRECEARLGHAIPAPFRDYYQAFNGFRGPTNSKFFYSLEELLETNDFLRSGEFPSFLNQHLAVGDPGTGYFWIVPIAEGSEVREWDAEWGDDANLLPGSIEDVWAAKKSVYDSIDLD